jgi:hypothetical protein
LVQLVSVGGLIGFGALVYFAICFVSGAVDQAQVKRLLRR